ncbi:type I-U CRISPR-associated protein Csb2 [Marinobacter sp.]|uniref:type I-G CRISPR-associated protein Csb2 n=1 Tax=Marinobacter sp. TaxID=50741 RepID=UPI003A8E645B
MIAIQLHFPTGKLHATPWGRQVNEGAVEWPPSPWRIVRALLAVWHHKYPEVPRDQVQPLIEKLSEPPEFSLPPASLGHTRHYMPAANDNKTKIFDTFVAVPRSDGSNSNLPGETTQTDRSGLVIAWPNQTLTPPEQQLLSQLVSAMSYFGRAESWVIARLLPEWSVAPNAMPLGDHELAPDQQLERALSPQPPEEYVEWRTKAVAEREQQTLEEKRSKALAKGKPTSKIKLTAADRNKIEALLPETLFDALHAETNDLRKAGWNRPPGSRWLQYVRPANAFSEAKTSPTKRNNKQRPTIARFAIAGTVVPKLTDAIRIGERARHFLMGISKNVCGGHTAMIFSGKESDGQPIRHRYAHQHAHYLCEANDSTGKITHLTVFAPLGFDDKDEQALSRFLRMWGDDGHDLQVVLLGIGAPTDFGGTDTRIGQAPISATSQHWISRTPFVLPRHLKLKAHERSNPALREAAFSRELIKAVQRELLNRPDLSDHVDSVQIEPLPCDSNGIILGGTFTPWLKFRRTRTRGGGSIANTKGYGFRLRLASPVTGPITLGYGSHFGLGQFVPGVE